MTDTIHQTEELEQTQSTDSTSENTNDLSHQSQRDLESTPEDIEADDDELEGADEGDFEEAPECETISLDKNDRSLSELHRWYQRGRLILDTEWQREYVWNRKRSSCLIESFLIDLPIPVIYLAVNQEEKYEVIDGLQRLTSVFDFFDNKYQLTGLEIKEDLNDCQFNDLPERLQDKLWDSTLRTFELSANTPKHLMFLIFERLNTGGVKLNEMEIRNCLYRGKLNDLIKELALLDKFKECVNQKNIHKRMKDRSHILRFLAFYQMMYLKAKKGLKAFFNEFCDTYRNPGEEKLNEFRNQFKKAIKAAYTIFGNRGFRLTSKSRSANASVFQVICVSFTDYDLGALTRSADAIYEEYLDLVSTDEHWVNCVSRSTGDSNRISYAFETWKTRLEQVMENSEPNDSTRLFSRKLKEELYRQSDVCKICEQKISLIDDAVLDHDKHYWRGGQTVPENARLVHRHCNATRSHNE
jgi:hypothetical protein